jgi:sugar phosphate isomerase/epimerase
MSNFLPSLLIPEIYNPVMNQIGFVPSLIERLGQEGFYRSFEISDGYDTEDRIRIRKAAQANNLTITQWLTFFIYKNNLDVTSLDSKLRLESVKQIKESLYLAAECGASNVAFIPGPDPGIHLREQAFEGFYEGLCDICEEASKFNLKVLVEPLDREAHKKRLLGPTSDAVDLISRVEKQFPNIGIAFDTAHAALNGEDIFQAMEIAGSQIHQIHFSNAVLNDNHPLFGDHHMPIGEPGFLTSEKIASIIQKADELGIQAEDGLRIAIEVRSHDLDECELNAGTARTILETALKTVG